MRWVAVLLATLATVTATVTDVLPRDVCALLLYTLAAAAVFNACFTILAGYEAWVPHLLQIQVYADLGILTLLLHFSGGVENPLSLSLLVNVVIAGILLSRRQCYIVATVASALFMLMAWGEWAGVLQHYFVPALPHGEAGWKDDASHDTLYVASTTFLQSGLFYFVAYFVTTLAERTRSQERRLKAVAEEAHAERQLLAQALETTATALRVVDPDLQPRWMNERWKEWFRCGGATNSALIEGADRLAGVIAAAEPSQSSQGAGDGGVRVTEVTLPCAPDQRLGYPRGGRPERVFRVTTAPLMNGDGSVRQAVELAQEITQQKLGEIQIMRAAKMAAVGELAGHVAHEVNNPVAIISAKARLLLADHRDAMSPKTAEEVGKIVELADRVARIAQGLLSFCRPSPAARTPLDIRVPIRKALSMVEQRARAAGVGIADRLPDAVPAVRASAAEMEEVFLNLFLNALDAMSKGGMLTVSAAGVDATFCPPAHGPNGTDATTSMAGAAGALAGGAPCVAVFVEDTGTGIPHEIRGEIFEPFFTTKGEGRGTGLGLAICLGIVRNHGGTIDVDSEPGRATRFAVRLPIDVSDSKPATRDV
jgi:signal transduction histidine kinase